MKYILGFIKAVIVATVVLLCVFNRHSVDVVIIEDRLVYETPLFVVGLVCALFGAFFAITMFISSQIKRGREIKELKKELKQATENIERLQNLPLVDEPVKTAEEGNV